MDTLLLRELWTGQTVVVSGHRALQFAELVEAGIATVPGKKIVFEMKNGLYYFWVEEIKK